MSEGLVRLNNGQSLETIRSECERLMSVDSPKFRTELYLRLLYGETWGNQARLLLRSEGKDISRTTRSFLEAIDLDQLKLERDARKRNLSHHIDRSCPSLKPVIGEDKFAKLVSEFVDSPHLWSARGRTLPENFCLFSSELFDTSSLESAVMRLSGIVSGIGALPKAPSPWADAIQTTDDPIVDGAISTEAFYSEWKLIDSSGELPTAINLSEIGARAKRLIVIAVFPGNRLLPFVVET